MTYSRRCGIDCTDCLHPTCECQPGPHEPTPAEAWSFWHDEPVVFTEDRTDLDAPSRMRLSGPISAPEVPIHGFGPCAPPRAVQCGLNTPSTPTVTPTNGA